MSRSSQTDPPALQRRATDEEALLRQSLPAPNAEVAHLHTQPGSASPQQAVTAPPLEPNTAADVQVQGPADSPEAAVSNAAAAQPAGGSTGAVPLETLDIGPAATPLPPSLAEDELDAAAAALPSASDIGQDASANGDTPAAVQLPSPADTELDAAAVPPPSASEVVQDAPAIGNMPAAVMHPSPADAGPDAAAAPLPSASDGGQDAPADGNVPASGDRDAPANGSMPASRHADEPTSDAAAAALPSASDGGQIAPANGSMPASWQHAEEPASAGAASPERPGPPPLPLPRRVALRSVSDGAAQSGAPDDGFLTPRINGAAASSSAPQSPCTDATSAQRHSPLRRCCRPISRSPTPVHDTLPSLCVTSCRLLRRLSNSENRLSSAAADPVA